MSDIKIGVKAEFDQSSVQAGAEKVTKTLEKTAAAVNRASKVKIDPFDSGVLKNFQKAEESLRRYLALSQGVARRLAATGQTGISSISQIDFNRLYPGNPDRARSAQRAAMQFGGHGEPGNQGGGHWAAAGSRVVNAGLGAAGGGGRVVGGAMSAGMSGGVGAGIAGLLGGIAALAVGKAVGAVMDKVGQAGQDNIGLDTLKRTLGDVNVGFDALKAQLTASARNLDLTFEESLRLGTSFSKLSGISKEQYTTISSELDNAGGFARSFGLDPSQSTAFFAEMRRSNVTSNPQESRDLALMISEGIAKSGTFSKTDEVLNALAGYTASQTASGMNSANVAGYAELFTGLTGSKGAGLDPTNAAALLGRVNSSIAGGGAAGEAGQNFLYSALGSRLGLNPIQAKILQEQGAFGTGQQAFGKDSAHAKFAGKYGLSTPGAAGSSVTNLEMVKDKLSQIYKGQPELMADAMSRLFGVSLSQAMVLSTIDGKQLGGLSSRLKKNGVNVGDVNATGLLKIAEIEADGEGDKDRRIKEAALQNQEKTLGSETREGLAGVERATVSAADKLLAPLNVMRAGIMLMAGEGKMSERQLMEKMAGLDSGDRLSKIDSDFHGKMKSAGGDLGSARQAIRDLVEKNRTKVFSGEMTQEEHARQLAPLLEREQAAIKADTDAREWRRKAIKEENQLLEENLKTLRGEKPPVTPASWGGENRTSTTATPAAAGESRGYGSMARGTNYDALFSKYEEQYGLPAGVLKATAMKENARMNPNAVGGMNANGTVDKGLMQHNSNYLEERGLTDSWADPERSIEEAAKLWKKNLARSNNDVRGAARRYNGSGPAAERYANDWMSIYGSTAIPAGAPAGSSQQSMNLNVSADPMQVMFPDGRPAGPPTALKVTQGTPVPSGAGR